jgi:hypothetical protein
LGSSSTNKAGKIDEKISAERFRMARLECTVAHMGFPAATLNKRIKETPPKNVFLGSTFYTYQITT